MPKRFLFIAFSIITTILLVVVPTLDLNRRLAGSLALFIFVWIVSYFVFKFSTNKKLRFKDSLFVSPVSSFLALGFSGISVFFPNFSPFFKGVIFLSFLVSFYFSLLAVNVMEVVGEREEKIPLLRVAQSAVYILSTGTLFLVATALYHSDLYFIFQGIGIFLTSFLLSFPLLKLLSFSFNHIFDKVSKNALVASSLTTAVSLSFSFLPLKSFSYALFIACFYYMLLGLYQHLMSRALSRKIALEYLGISLLTMFVVFFLE